jgi:hypothetical protein
MTEWDYVGIYVLLIAIALVLVLSCSAVSAFFRKRKEWVDGDGKQLALSSQDKEERVFLNRITDEFNEAKGLGIESESMNGYSDIYSVERGHTSDSVNVWIMASVLNGQPRTLTSVQAFGTESEVLYWLGHDARRRSSIARAKMINKEIDSGSSPVLMDGAL